VLAQGAAKSPRQSTSNANAEVDYGAPSKRGRVIFGEKDALLPYGKMWRAGANAPTTLTLKKDATIGGKSVKAGKYLLMIIPGAKEWTYVLNTKIEGVWSTGGYDEKLDVVRVNVPVKEHAVTEQLTFKLEADGLHTMWDNVHTVLPIQF
jgi:hypothetical protein